MRLDGYWETCYEAYGISDDEFGAVKGCVLTVRSISTVRK